MLARELLNQRELISRRMFVATTSWEARRRVAHSNNPRCATLTKGAMEMSTWTKIALTLTVLGTLGVGVLPMIGRTTTSSGGISFRATGWRTSWLVAWIVFLIGAVLTAYAH